MKTSANPTASILAKYSKYFHYFSRALIAVLILAGVISGGATLLNLLVTAVYNS